jgi:hypothetical protein
MQHRQRLMIVKELASCVIRGRSGNKHRLFRLSGENLSPLRAVNYCLCIFNATLKSLTDITEEAPGRLRNTTVSETTSVLNSISDKRNVKGPGPEAWAIDCGAVSSKKERR